MKWFGLLLIYMSFAAWGAPRGSAKWSRLGFSFEAGVDLYNSQQQKLLLASTDIAETLSEIQLEKLPSTLRDQIKTKNITLIFEKNSATDAMFFPPKTKRNTEEWIITLNPVLLDTPDYLKIIAHEYFHAVHHSVNPNEESWVREGLAQLFESRIYGGFNFAHIHAGLTQSNFPLEAAFDVNNYHPEKYGNSLLYFYYLTTHCDQNDQLFWKLVENGESGRNGITRALESINSSCHDFNSTAEGFSLAKMVNSYSGFEQSAQTFIHASSQRLEVDLAKEQKSLQDPNYWSLMMVYQPQRLSLATAQELVKTAPQNAKWWGLEKNFPNRVKPLQATELGTLSKSWDVGFFLAD